MQQTTKRKPRPPAGELTRKGVPAKPGGRKPGEQGTVPYARLLEVAKWLASGADTYHMCHELAKKYEVTPRTIRNWRDRVLRDMQAELKEAGFLEPDLEKVLGVRRLEKLYSLAVTGKDYRAAANIVKLRLQIAGAMGQTIKVNLPSVPAPPGPKSTDKDPARQPRAQIGVIILPPELPLAAEG